MIFVLGVSMLGVGLLALFLAARRSEQSAATGELSLAKLSQIVVVQALILGGLGIVIGGAANLIAGQ